jgi:hypothetical protein
MVEHITIPPVWGGIGRRISIIGWLIQKAKNLFGKK